MKPDISILLPVRNGADFIKKSIESVLAQDHQNFELLISDDSSTDETLAIIAQYTDDRIIVFKQKTGLGQFGNFNFLLKNATTPIVQFWSHDDVMLPNQISTTLRFHEYNNSIGMSYCGSSYINEKGLITLQWENDQTPAILDKKNYARFSVAFGCLAGSISQVAINRAKLGKNYLFNEKLVHAGDFELWSRIAENHDVGFINKELCYIRNHSNQVTHRIEGALNSSLENIPIMNQLLSWLDLSTKLKKKVKRELLMVYYFNNIIKLLVKKEIKFFKIGLNALTKEDNIFLLSLFWMKTKILGKEYFEKNKTKLIDQLFNSKL